MYYPQFMVFNIYVVKKLILHGFLYAAVVLSNIFVYNIINMNVAFIFAVYSVAKIFKF